MKHFKKILCIVLTAAMVLSVTCTAFADSNAEQSDSTAQKIATNILLDGAIFPLLV